MWAPFHLHPSFEAGFVREHTLFTRILRSYFAVAGVMWILVFILPFHNAEEHSVFRLHQYQLYVVLLSLWGYDYRREVFRLRLLAAMAARLRCTIPDIEWASLDSRTELPKFSVFVKRGLGPRWFPILFVYSFFAVASWIIFMQLHLIFD